MVICCNWLCHGEMVLIHIIVNLNMLIWFDGEMVQLFLYIFSMFKWCNVVTRSWWTGEVTTFTMAELILWWGLTVDWFIISALVSLGFIQHFNTCDPDDNRSARIFYLGEKVILLISLIFGLSTFLSFLMAKWCNGEIISDGGVMVVQRFRCCVLGNFWRVLVFTFFVWSGFLEF